MNTTATPAKRATSAPAAHDFDADRAALAADEPDRGPSSEQLKGVWAPVPVALEYASIREGAAAWHAMLSIIQAAPMITIDKKDRIDDDDDGVRRNYGVADKLLAAALDAYGSNPGFRQGLANLLLEFVESLTDVYSAVDLFSDNGYRPATAKQKLDADGRDAASAAEMKELKDVIREMDCITQDAMSELAAMTVMVVGSLASHNAPTAKVLGMICSKAELLKNDINVLAESVGCDYVDA